MRPMLAKTYGPRYNRYPCFVQPKLNGVRALYQGGIFQSRDEKIWSNEKLFHLKKQLVEIEKLIGPRILDGELYLHGLRLQTINGAVAINSKTPRDDTHLIEYHVFDCITQEPNQIFSERFLKLGHDINNANISHIKVVQTSWMAKAGIEDLFRYHIANGYEGIMLRPDGPYEPSSSTGSRSQYLWKYKSWEDGEFLCVGITKGDGKASIGIGALVLQTIDGTPFHCGTGFQDFDRIELLNNSPFGKLVRVRYNSLTSDGIPTPCAFVCVMS